MTIDLETNKKFEMTLTDVKIRSFNSRIGSATAPSSRVYYVVLPDDLADTMREYGWEVKTIRNDSILYVNSPLDFQAVKPFTFDGHPMRRSLSFIDVGEVLTCDIHISGFHWVVGKMSGVKNYVTALDAKTSRKESDHD